MEKCGRIIVAFDEYFETFSKYEHIDCHAKRNMVRNI